MVDGGAFLTSVGAGVSVRGTHSVRLVGAETVAAVGDTHGCLDVHGDWHERWAPSGLHSGSAGDGRRRASLRADPWNQRRGVEAKQRAWRRKGGMRGRSGWGG